MILDVNNMKKEKTKNQILSIFPTPVVKVNINRSFTKPEINCISSIPMREKVENRSANHQSKNSYLFDTFATKLKDIIKFCEDELERYMKHIEGIDTDLAGLRITQSWLNKTKPGEGHDSHSHYNSYLSGVLYIKCLPNDCINFKNRSHKSYNNIEFLKKENTPWNTQGVIVGVKKGDLILFPSWVPHYVDKNNTDKERISLSFNTFPVGEIGDYYGSRLKL